GNRARVELAEEIAPVRARAEAPDERPGQRGVDRQPRRLGHDEPVGQEVVRGDRSLGDGDSHRFLATSSSPGPNGIHPNSRSIENTARTTFTSHRARPARATDCSAASPATSRRARRMFIGRMKIVSYARTIGKPQNFAFTMSKPSNSAVSCARA